MSKGYEVFFEKRAKNSLKKIDKTDAKIIMAWISKNLVNCKNPYIHGKPLTGNLKDKWKYRVGDYRLITNIDDEKVIILIVEVGHKNEIYK